MSDSKTRFPLEVANFVATAVLQQLEPYCSRIEIAGSIRRRVAEIGDIEIVCIPGLVSAPGTLFTVDGKVRDPEFARAVKSLGELKKGDPATGKYFSVLLGKEFRESIKIDIFVATPENWGLIYAIRTGSADFSHHTLAVGWSKAGYFSREGTLYARDGTAIPVREEADLFTLIGLPFVNPQNRL